MPLRPPHHPAGPAFDKARDSLAAWRAQQEKLLSDAQRSDYEAIKRDEERRQKERARQLAATRERRIIEEKGRRLLKHADLALRLLPLKAMRERYALRLAVHAVGRSDHLEMQRLAHEARQRADDHLRHLERERQTARDRPHTNRITPDLAEAFRRAAERKRQERGRDGRERGGR